MCHIFVADKATLFKFRILTDWGQFLFTDCKLPPKWAWRGWRTWPNFEISQRFQYFANG